ncbi:MAG: hypothetical protein N2380_02675 [bacterium]|nr:hypothetical protein [bacterium]
MRRILLAILSIVVVISLILTSVPFAFSQRKYNEAPMLAELVKAGKLPPVEQRLPKNPVVVDVVEEIGKYGGTVRMIHMAPESFVSNYDWWVERLLRISPKDL